MNANIRNINISRGSLTVDNINIKTPITDNNFYLTPTVDKIFLFPPQNHPFTCNSFWPD